MTTHNTVQVWMQMDASPFKEIRQILTQELHRSPEDVQAVSFNAEVRQVPSEDGEWANYESTGRSWFTLTFPGEEQVTFVRDSEGVRLEELSATGSIQITELSPKK
jgi:hypothetical protein